MIKKPFQDWTYEDVEQIFGYEERFSDPLLVKWLSASHPLKSHQTSELERLANILLHRSNSWNEDELKFFFISPLVNMVEYDFERYKAFTQRPMSAEFEKEGYEASGRVEVMVAKGKLNPMQPYFFIHEYKPEKNRDNDPLGQLLIAMHVAKTKNNQQFPIYGCYVSGRNWFFVILNENHYSVSKAYDATDVEDLTQILCSLIEIKTIIEPWL